MIATSIGFALLVLQPTESLVPPKNPAETCRVERSTSRREALSWITTATTATVLGGGGGGGTDFPWSLMSPPSAHAEVDKIPDRLDTEAYLRTGMVSNPMGVSGQAGKSKPETGVMLRDGSEVLRDASSGNVLAEILVQAKGLNDGNDNLMPVLASFVSQDWPLAKGTVFDVECRDPTTGDGAFLAVSGNLGGKSLQDVSSRFFVDQLTSPTGRFSFYGEPTDVKVQKSTIEGDYRVVDFSFSTLSQSTQAEIPRKAKLIVTIPEGSAQAVMLVGSASAARWNKGSSKKIATVADSFRAIPAPQSGLKLRAKPRRNA